MVSPSRPPAQKKVLFFGTSFSTLPMSIIKDLYICVDLFSASQPVTAHLTASVLAHNGEDENAILEAFHKVYAPFREHYNVNVSKQQYGTCLISDCLLYLSQFLSQAIYQPSCNDCTMTIKEIKRT